MRIFMLNKKNGAICSFGIFIANKNKVAKILTKTGIKKGDINNGSI